MGGGEGGRRGGDLGEGGWAAWVRGFWERGVWGGGVCVFVERGRLFLVGREGGGSGFRVQGITQKGKRNKEKKRRKNNEIQR